MDSIARSAFAETEEIVLEGAQTEDEAVEMAKELWLRLSVKSESDGPKPCVVYKIPLTV